MALAQTHLVLNECSVWTGRLYHRHMGDFQLVAPFKPTGDQPQAIEKLVAGLAAGRKHQVLLGATGTGWINVRHKEGEVGFVRSTEVWGE